MKWYLGSLLGTMVFAWAIGDANAYPYMACRDVTILGVTVEVCPPDSTGREIARDNDGRSAPGRDRGGSGGSSGGSGDSGSGGSGGEGPGGEGPGDEGPGQSDSKGNGKAKGKGAQKGSKGKGHRK